MLRTALVLSLALVLALLTASCEKFDAPPAVALPNAQDGLLADPAAPVVVKFTKPIELGTLRLSIARNVTDIEGNLADEVDPPGELSTLFTHDPDDGDRGGSLALSPDATTVTITPKTPLPITPRLVLLVEPGLEEIGGSVTRARRKLVFGFEVKLSCTKPSKVVSSGTYFYLMDVKKPIATQVQLFVVLQALPTGEILGQFTRARRSPDSARCPFPCKSTEACRTLPAPVCVIPSERAGTPDEFPDYIPDPGLPTGYSFTVHGCAEDLPDGTASYVNLPVDVDVPTPQVTLRNTRFASTFSLDAAGLVRGTGAISADDVLIGSISSGRGEGSLAMRRVPDGIPGIPQPPAGP
jgi:hypothetical protein